MEAYELIITAKTRTKPFAIVSADDFEYRMGQPVEPHQVLEQSVFSLYCLDHANRCVLFVETPPHVDLLQAPFYFIAQYEEAIRLIALPYDTLHTLAKEVDVDPQKIILFYSTGRCGSTLFSHVLNLNQTIVSYSEPDVFSQLVRMRTLEQSSNAETATLLRDCLFVMCANARQQGFQHYAFKFRSYVLSVSDLLFETIPQANVLFMYRHALTWAHSFSRAFGGSDDELAERLLDDGWGAMIPSLNEQLAINPQAITWVDYLAHMWVSTMQDIRWLQEQGSPLTCARFEELKATPYETIRSAFVRLGLPMPNPNQLTEILAKDSQAGTDGAQNKQPARILTDNEKIELSQLISKLDSSLTPSTILRCSHE